MYMKVEVPASETGESGTGAERRATATAEPLDAAAARSADGSFTEPRDARDTATSAPLPPPLNRAAALDRSPSFPFCFLLPASYQSVYSTLLFLHCIVCISMKPLTRTQNPRTQQDLLLVRQLEVESGVAGCADRYSGRAERAPRLQAALFALSADRQRPAEEGPPIRIHRTSGVFSTLNTLQGTPPFLHFFLHVPGYISASSLCLFLFLLPHLSHSAQKGRLRSRSGARHIHNVLE